MRAMVALMRASLLSASSYRLGFLFSIVGLVFSFVPIYYITRAMQPVMAKSIATQGGDFFAFMVVGLIVLAILPSAVQSLPSSISTGIATGNLESLLGTPAPIPAILAGLIGYEMSWSLLRAVLLAVGGLAFGVRISLSGLVPGMVVFALIVAGYLALGAVAAAMVIAFRTTGPFVSGVLSVTTLLGGVYFPTQVIPSWVARVSDIIPLTYGLRALRRLWLEGASLGDVAGDVAILLVMTLALCAGGAWVLGRALTTARQRGTLGQY